MLSEHFVSIGHGKLLAYLRGEIRAARTSLLLVGPWIDDYVADEFISVAPRDLQARVLIRSQDQVDPNTWTRISAGLTIFSNHWRNLEVRTLPYLHAKVICIDNDVIYLGSANWYRFSLERSLETVIRGKLGSVEGLGTDLNALWNQGTRLQVAVMRDRDLEEQPAIGILHEVVDPIAARALQENPKAFRLGKKHR